MISLCAASLVAVQAAGQEGAPSSSLPGVFLEADIALLGEVHDNPVHHRNQAVLVSQIEPAALVFEMLSPGQAAAADRAPRGTPDALAETLLWDETGWPGFSDYYPIFTAAPEARLYGAALPRADVRRAFAEGAAGVYGNAALFPSLDAAEQAERERLQGVAHCDAMPEEMLAGMVEAQRLRDAAFARAATEALAETGGPVVVITGNGHARTDWGMPRYLEALAPNARVVSLGQVEITPDGDLPYDVWIVTAPAERADPCAAFR